MGFSIKGDLQTDRLVTSALGKLSETDVGKQVLQDRNIDSAEEANDLLNVRKDMIFNHEDIDAINSKLPENKKLTDEEAIALGRAFEKAFPSSSGTNKFVGVSMLFRPTTGEPPIPAWTPSPSDTPASTISSQGGGSSTVSLWHSLPIRFRGANFDNPVRHEFKESNRTEESYTGSVTFYFPDGTAHSVELDEYSPGEYRVTSISATIVDGKLSALSDPRVDFVNPLQNYELLSSCNELIEIIIVGSKPALEK